MQRIRLIVQVNGEVDMTEAGQILEHGQQTARMQAARERRYRRLVVNDSLHSKGYKTDGCRF
jgi:hypothetical protein